MPTPMSLEKAAEAYLEHVKTENRRHKTVVKYKGFFRSFCEFAERTTSFAFRR